MSLKVTRQEARRTSLLLREVSTESSAKEVKRVVTTSPTRRKKETLSRDRSNSTRI